MQAFPTSSVKSPFVNCDRSPWPSLIDLPVSQPALEDVGLWAPSSGARDLGSCHRVLAGVCSGGPGLMVRHERERKLDACEGGPGGLVAARTAPPSHLGALPQRHAAAQPAHDMTRCAGTAASRSLTSRRRPAGVQSRVVIILSLHTLGWGPPPCQACAQPLGTACREQSRQGPGLVHPLGRGTDNAG